MRALLHRPWLALLSCLTLLGFAPLISAATASAIALRYGCRLDEGDAHPCLVLGYDVGEVLYDMLVASWLALGTWPLMIVTVVLWIVLASLAFVRWVRRRATPDSAS